MLTLLALLGCSHVPPDPATVDLARVPYEGLVPEPPAATLLALRAHREVLVRESRPVRGPRDVIERLHLHAIASDFGEAMSAKGPIGFYGVDGAPANLHDLRIAQLLDAYPAVAGRDLGPMVSARMPAVEAYRAAMQERPSYRDVALVLALLARPVTVDGAPFEGPE